MARPAPHSRARAHPLVLWVDDVDDVQRAGSHRGHGCFTVRLWWDEGSAEERRSPVAQMHGSGDVAGARSLSDRSDRPQVACLGARAEVCGIANHISGRVELRLIGRRRGEHLAGGDEGARL